jgi:hypothetical protein
LPVREPKSRRGRLYQTRTFVLALKSKESLCFIERICQLGSALRGSSAPQREYSRPQGALLRIDLLRAIQWLPEHYREVIPRMACWPMTETLAPVPTRYIV